jgi:Putative peptidoglycan binding domain
MKKIIKLTESNLIDIIRKVLQEQKPDEVMPGQPETKYDINPKGLKFGDGGRRHPEQVEDVKELQRYLMKTGYLRLKGGAPTGYFGSLTQSALNAYKGIKTAPVKSVTQPSKQTTQQTKCIAFTPDECKKMSTTSEVIISTGEEKQCAKWMVKCLSQYDKELKGMDAWKLLPFLKSKYPEKYNMFTSGEIDWNKVYDNIKKLKITKRDCECFEPENAKDSSCRETIPNLVPNLVPNSPNFDINKLQLGDIVGLYHSSSQMKGKAFCERLAKKLDDKGNIINKEPFSFNTHVGFVTAIIKGVPIIAHNVHGTYKTVPATKLLNKSGDMIVWVVSDPNVAKAAETRK